MSRRVTVIFVGLFVIGAFGCGPESDAEPEKLTIEEQPLQGLINGASWRFKSGVAEPRLNEEGFNIRLLSVEMACTVGLFPDDERKVLSFVPETPGTYPLKAGSDSRTVTLVHPDEEDGIPQNLATTRGRIVIEKVTDTEVAGAMVARFDDENRVNGNFTLTRCDNVDTTGM